MRPRITVFLSAIILSACSAADEPAGPPAIPVRTITVTAQEIPNLIELPGRVEPVRVAEVRARVTGIVQQRLYKEGTDVRAEQPLFRIDPAELRASYAQTQASLERARATAANANAVVERYRPLVAENAISQQEFDAAVAASREANANVAQISAQLRSASLQLGYTTVKAPIAGRAGRALVTEGALVSQTEGTLLTRIEQISPVYVSFAQSATEVLRVRRAIADGTLKLGKGEQVEVRLTFSDGSEYPIPGFVDFLDFSVAETTGTVQLRAEFSNPSGMLLPGEFVRARIFAGRRANGVMIPQRAVSIGENSSMVFVIDGDGNAAVRPIKLGQLVDQKWIVESGLKPGDVVITSNLQKLQPGTPVTAKNAPVADKKKPSAKTGTKPSATAR